MLSRCSFELQVLVPFGGLSLRVEFAIWLLMAVVENKDVLLQLGGCSGMAVVES